MGTGYCGSAVFKAYVREAIEMGRLPSRLQIAPAGLTRGALRKGQLAVDVWDPVSREGWDLTTVTARQELILSFSLDASFRQFHGRSPSHR